MRILSIVLLLNFAFSLKAEILPKNPPADLQIIFYKPQGMSGRGFHLTISKTKYTLEEREFSDVKSYSDLMDDALWTKLYESLQSNRLNRIQLDPDFIHDFDSYSIEAKWNDGKNIISVIQSGRKVRKADSEKYDKIVSEFLKAKESLQKK